MKDLNNIVVFIKDEAMLEEARRILIENGEVLNLHSSISEHTGLNYLYYHRYKKYFTLGPKVINDTEITLTELETLLKER